MNIYSQKIKELKGQFVYSPIGEVPRTVSDQELEEAENQIGYQLPLDYKIFIKDFGGFSFYDLEEIQIPHWSLVSLDTFYGLNVNGHLNILRRRLLKMSLNLIPPYILPIANDSANNDICIVLSGNEKGRIYFLPADSPSTSSNYIEEYSISSSFDEFINSLRLSS
jgi:hypothetical protein